jgi:hypothetical protein
MIPRSIRVDKAAIKEIESLRCFFVWLYYRHLWTQWLCYVSFEMLLNRICYFL